MLCKSPLRFSVTYPRLCWRGFSWGSTFTLDNAEFPLPEGQELCDSEVSVEIKHTQRLLAWPVCLGWLHSSLFSLHRWYLDELCCQKHAGTGKGGFPPHVGHWGPVGAAAWGAPGSAEAGWGWLRLPGTSRVLRADGSKKKKLVELANRADWRGNSSKATSSGMLRHYF